MQFGKPNPKTLSWLLQSCGFAAIITLISSTAPPILAQTPPKRVITMIPPESTGGLPQVVGGETQDNTKWPATLKYYLDGNLSCTSTIVGARTIITAAHCLDSEAKTEIRFGAGTQPYELTCEHHPRYRYNGLIADVALCLSDRALPVNFQYENLDTYITRVRRNTKLFLLGYGCRKFEDIGNPSKIGQLYGGVSQVASMPASSEDHYRTQGGVVICPGDSGGSAYVLNASGKPEGLRSIVGINSGFIPEYRESAITPLTGSVTQFIVDWSKDNGVTICGIHDTAVNCRDRLAP